MDKEIKNKIKEYELKLLEEKKNRETLLSAKSDFTMLESLIQKCNANPDLKIEVHLTDGTIILLRSYHDEKKKDYQLINGEDYEVVK